MKINHAEALRKAAAEIRTEGHNGWGNTCDWAADEIDASQAEIERLRTIAREARDELQEWVNATNIEGWEHGPSAKLIKRIDAALSGGKP